MDATQRSLSPERGCFPFTHPLQEFLNALPSVQGNSRITDWNAIDWDAIEVQHEDRMNCQRLGESRRNA
jgi:hypothetical protein